MLNAKKIMATMSTCLLLMGCGKNTQKETMPDELIGIWQQQGYGRVAQINPDGFTIYETTKISCVKDISGDKSDWDAMVASTNFKEGVLNVIQNDIKMYQFDKIPQLPQTCTTQLPNTPSNNFEIVWNTFDENYAFFDLRNVDWKAQYNQYKPMISDEMSSEQWFKVISSMVEPLQDAHVILINDSGTLSYENRIFSPFLKEILQDCETQIDVNGCVRDALNQLLAITQNYIENPTLVLNDNLTYGTVKNNPSVAYFNLTAMSGYDNENSEKYDTQTLLVDQFMQNWLTNNPTINTLILDLRFNGGGYDENSIAWANWLVGESKIVMTKEAKWDDGFTQAIQIRTHAKTNAFKGKVMILTSKMSVSAAETFLLAVKSYDNVTIMGEQTQGAFSDTLLKKLPNGVNFSISNEVYKDIDGIVHEAKGIPVDIEMQNYTQEEIRSKQDFVLEKAIELAQ